MIDSTKEHSKCLMHISASNTAEKFLADSEDILRDAKVRSLIELQTKNLAVSDELAHAVHKWAIGLAADEEAMGFMELESFLIAKRTLAKQLNINLTKRKALQIISAMIGVSAIVGNSINGWYIKRSGLGSQTKLSRAVVKR